MHMRNLTSLESYRVKKLLAAWPPGAPDPVFGVFTHDMVAEHMAFMASFEQYQRAKIAELPLAEQPKALEELELFLNPHRPPEPAEVVSFHAPIGV